MAFQYTSPSGIKLDHDEDQLLESIDSFNYPLNGWGNLGALHQNLRGGVVLSDKQKTRHFRYELTVAECKDIINELDVEISKINDELDVEISKIKDDELDVEISKIKKIKEIKDELSTLETRLKEARNNHDCDRANRIEEEMVHLGMKMEGLKSKSNEARNNYDRDRANRIEEEMGHLGMKMDGLNSKSNEARNNYDRDRANRIEEEMIHLVMKIIKRNVYQRAIRNGNGKIKRNGNGKIKIEGDFDILGEYLPSEKKVVLYYNTIHKYPNPCYLLAVVYVHEMMHAYLDAGSIIEYFDKIEEPIAEYGMLRFFKQFGSSTPTSTYPGILEFAQTNVEKKQNALGIAHYGFGYCLFKKGHGIDWLQEYYQIKPSLSPTGPNIRNYLDFWKTGLYPYGEEEFCMVVLLLTLQMGFNITNAINKLKLSGKQTQGPKAGSRRVYTINGKGNYSMYEVIEEFAKDQMKNGKTIQDVDDIFWQFVGNGRRQRMVMVSDVKTKVYRYQYTRNGKTYEHVHEFRFNGSDYYCMKEWDGDENGNFQKLMNEINKAYPGFQIVEVI